MPSDESGRGSPNTATPPSSGVVDRGVPASGVPASTSQPPPAELVSWGPVRDAVTSVHNLEVLLKSPRVAPKVLEDVMPELFEGAAVLRRAFTAAAQSGSHADALEARRELAAFATARLDELERAMRQASSSELDARARLALEQVVTRVSVDLNACAELLDLSERAERAAPTELGLEELAWVSIRNTRGSESDFPVRLVRDVGDCVLRADPHVFKRLVAFAVAQLHAVGVAKVTLRVLCESDMARIEIGPTTDAETVLVPSSMRIVRRVPPTDAIVAAAARSAAIELTQSGTTIALGVPRVP
jgi:hypothetical protein